MDGNYNQNTVAYTISNKRNHMDGNYHQNKVAYTISNIRNHMDVDYKSKFIYNTKSDNIGITKISSNVI